MHFNIWQLAIVLLIVVLIFGTKRLKSIGSDLGGAFKGFKRVPITYTISATVAPGASGSLANTATVAVPVGVTDPVPGNNASTSNNANATDGSSCSGCSASPRYSAGTGTSARIIGCPSRTNTSTPAASARRPRRSEILAGNR